MTVDELTWPASISATETGRRDRRRLALATCRATGAIVDHDRYFLELRACPEALDFSRDGVPLLAQHWNKHEGFLLDRQLGQIIDGRFTHDGSTLELVCQLGHSERATAVWRDLVSGVRYGCSIGFYDLVTERPATEPALPKPYMIARYWRLSELTICALGRSDARDVAARVRHCRGLDELVVSLAAERAARDELVGRQLPADYASSLRDRINDISASVAHAVRVDDVDQLRAALSQEIEAWIADWRGSQ